jgi:hypothetical protein
MKADEAAEEAPADKPSVAAGEQFVENEIPGDGGYGSQVASVCVAPNGKAVTSVCRWPGQRTRLRLRRIVALSVGPRY